MRCTGVGGTGVRIGVAVYYRTNPEFCLCEFYDRHNSAYLLSTLAGSAPAEILVDSLVEGSSIPHQIARHMDSYIQRGLPGSFQETAGMAFLCEHVAAPYASVVEDVRSRPLAVAALHAVVQFLAVTDRVIFRPHSAKVVYMGLDGTVHMDASTISCLELVDGRRGAPAHAVAASLGERKGCSLLKTIDATVTRGGHRLLRSNLVQPPLDLDIIRARQAAAQELSRSPELAELVQESLSTCSDFDRLLAVLVSDSVRQ